ncbi:guanine deaminase [Aliiroseovarius crassostreae]|uniref:guanine deaminase n=1 Tax=Aliiroseovarius crassostreae TaxID=154981 RepID=UPI0021B03720|nr:guanine deaminase [Aliiroseovarius crassostreae]UWQ05272.1 guanine deaminase [Aliiroseovarius crassostreae]
MQLLLGQTLTFTENPFTTRPDKATRHHTRGGVVIDGGKIIAVGPADDMCAQYPQAQMTDYGNALISPGFIDAHAHYPQTAIIASWGKRLIDWLNSYTFPEESRFADRIHADEIANRYFDLVTAAGTTTTVSYCTIHPESVEAYFTAAQHRGLRAFGGKTCMDRNAPDTLTDTAQSAYEDSKALLEKWHGVDRLSYVITPRFAPTSTPEQLDALGTLWREHPDLLMQTHISEQHEEIAWVQDLFPDSRDYLDVYEKFGLAREGALFGHAIHLTERERDRLHEMKASLIHCPTSNMFIGSGLFDMAGLMATGQRIGLATDTGGGSSFSMLRTMAAAYEVGQLSGTALHPAQLWWLATAGSAQSLLMGDVIGTLAPGYEADLAVIDLSSTPAIAQRAARAVDLWQALFPTIMMGDDRAVTSVWAGGRKLY